MFIRVSIFCTIILVISHPTCYTTCSQFLTMGQHCTEKPLLLSSDLQIGTELVMYYIGLVESYVCGVYSQWQNQIMVSML